MALYRGVLVRRSDENSKRAFQLLRESLPTVKASGNQKDLAEAYSAMGYLYRLQHDYKSALDSYQQALAIFETLPDQESRLTGVKNLIRTTQRLLDKGR